MSNNLNKRANKPKVEGSLVEQDSEQEAQKERLLIRKQTKLLGKEYPTIKQSELHIYVNSQYQDIQTAALHLAKGIGVSPSSVKAWLYNQQEVPSDKLAVVEQATEGAVTRESLRPDLYPADLGTTTYIVVEPLTLQQWVDNYGLPLWELSFSWGISETVLRRVLKGDRLFPAKKVLNVELLTQGLLGRATLRPDVYGPIDNGEVIL